MKIKLNDESLEELIIDMRKNAVELGQVTQNLDLLEEKRKELIYRAYLEVEKGTEMTKKAIASTNPKVVELNELISDLKGKEQKLRWFLKISEIHSNLWRSSNSSKSQEHKLYNSYS
tara:strand:- start:2204 stop:2554 length:351 start_codon:yes stop_codon:yes gene_type:complete